MLTKILNNRSSIYLFSKIFAAIINLFSIYIFTRLFNPEIYGSYLLFISYVIFLSYLIFGWHRSSVFRYFYKFKENYNSYIRTSYFSFYGLCTGLIFLCLFLLLFFNDNDIRLIIILSAIGALLRSNFDLNQSLFNISKYDNFYGIHVIIRPLLFIVICFITYYMYPENNYALIIGFTGSFLISIIYSNYFFQKHLVNSEFSNLIFKKFTSYGLPLIGLFIFDYILAFSDRLLIGYYLGSDMVGIYGANYDLIKQIIIFLMIIQNLIIYPDINKSYEKEKLNKVNKLMNLNFNIYLIIFLPLTIFIANFSEFISSILIGKNFIYSSNLLLPIFSFMFFIYGIKMFHFDYIFQLKEKTITSMKIIFVGSIINLLMNILLIPQFHLIGAASSTMLSYMCCLLLSFFIGEKITRLKFNILIKVVSFVSISLIVSYLLRYFDTHGLLQMIIFVVVYASLTIKYNFNILLEFKDRFS